MNKSNKKEKTGKNAIIVVFYAIFILILIVLIRINRNQKITEELTERENIIEKLQKNNYSFSIKVSDGIKTYYYSGKRFNNKLQYSYQQGNNKYEYYTYDEITLLKENEKYVLSTKPVVFFDYLDFNNIKEILNKSVKSEKENIYLITNLKLDEIIKSEFLSEDRTTNEIIIEENENNIKIYIDLSNYFNYNEKERPGNIQFEFNYYGINEVKNFEIIN